MLNNLGDGNCFSGPPDRIHVQEAQQTEGTVNLGQSPQERKEEEMKKMKKFFAMFLTLAMVLGMSITSFAAGEQKITVSNVPAGATVKYEKIAEAEPTTPLGWSLVEGISLSGDVSLDTLAAVAGGNANAAEGTINSNEDVAKAIQGITLNKTATASGTSAEITGVTPGLYVIEVEATGYTFTRMLAYVAWNDDNTAAVDNTSVQAKGAPHQVNKEISTGDNNSVSVGDLVPYTITAQYPYMAPNLTKRTFTITDTVAGGTIDGNVTVTVGSATDGITTINDDKKGFSVVFNYNEANAGQTVTIAYNVLVTDEAESLENAVSSSFGYTENGTPETTETDAVVISPKVSVTFGKVDGSDDPQALSGATFTLYVESATDATHLLKDGKIVAAGEGETATLKVVGTDQTEIGTDNRATATFDKLDADKNYWVAETQAPNGYALNDTAYKLEGGGSTAGIPTLVPAGETYTVDGETKTVDKDTMVTINTAEDFTVNNGNPIVNTTLSSLPSTGGIGTTIFTVGGCAIMIIAAGLYFSLRRKTAK